MWNREKQSLLETRTRSLQKAETQVEELTAENKAVYEENKDLRFENEEQKLLINRIKRIVEGNTCNNSDMILRKIKELVNDHQSNN